MERTSKKRYGDPNKLNIHYSPNSRRTEQTKLSNEPEGDDGEKVLEKYRIHKRA